MDYLAEIRHFHAEAVERSTGKPIGCSPNAVSDLERQIGFPLPEAYRQYLLWMGRDYQGVFRGSDWFIDDVAANTKMLPQLLAGNRVDFELPEHYLVFFSHQGYMAAWFELPKEDENPPSWFFSEVREAMVPALN